MRIECDRCGKVQMLNETHKKRSNMLIRDILARMRHDGCGGRGRTDQHALRYDAHRHLSLRRMTRCTSVPAS
jgi:hypothetical protein